MQHVIGIDIGGTSTKIGVIRYDDHAEVLSQASVPTNATDAPDLIVQQIAALARDLSRSCNAPVNGAGVGCPGLIEPGAGVVLKSPNLPTLDGYPLRDQLSRLLGLPVEIQNDANAAVLGEYLFGPNKQVRNLILLTLGTGVGGGVVADGKLLQGADNAAAELGHLKVEPNGAQCGCGRRGCLEAYVGAAGIARLAQEFLATGTASRLTAELLTTRAIADAAAAGDELARRVLRRVGEYLGRGIATLIDVFNPEKVLLGGGASAAIEFLRPGITPAVQEFASFDQTRNRTVVERAALPDDINILGAAATFLIAQPAAPLQSRGPGAGHAASPSYSDVIAVSVAPQDYVLGVHVGVTSLNIGLLKPSGEVVVKADRRLPAQWRETEYPRLVAEVAKGAADIIRRASSEGVAPERIVGGGVVVPAPVDGDTGLVVRAPSIPCLENVYLGRDLGARLRQEVGLGLDFAVDNDANGACLAEAYFGLGKGHEHILIVLLCTGLGGAMILNGRLYRGHKKGAGEIGHTTVQAGGARCRCGNRGCLEMVASGSALVRNAAERQILANRGADLHYMDLVAEAGRGNAEVLELFKTMGYYLGIGLASAINILNPALVILSGALSAAHRFFLPEAQNEFAFRVFAGLECDVVPTKQLDDASIRAALSTYLNYRKGLI